MRKLILLTGPPRAGKDTVGRLLAERLPSSTLFKFADPVKRVAHAIILGHPRGPENVVAASRQATFWSVRLREIERGIRAALLPLLPTLDVHRAVGDVIAELTRPHPLNTANRFEQDKDRAIPLRAGNGRTWRQVYIAVSEQFMKPVFGAEIFGQLLWASFAAHDCKVGIVTDCGFRVEVDTVLSEAFRSGMLACLVAVARPGCTFAGDSREDLAPRSQFFIDNREQGFESLQRNPVFERLVSWARHPDVR